MSGRDVAESVWRDQSLWSRTANRSKSRIDQARWIALVGVVAAAVAGTLAASTAGSAPGLARVFAVVAGLGALVVTTVRPYWSGQRLRDWTRLRSVSEALKSDVYLWLAGAGPFEDDTEGTVLGRRAAALAVDAADLRRYTSGVEPATRSLPAVAGSTDYFTVRVGGQIEDYYELRARGLETRLRVFRSVEVALGVIGVLLGAVAVLSVLEVAAWITVVTTITTAVAVHVAAGRWEFSYIEYTRTALRLRELRTRAAATPPDSAAARDLAVEAESVISIENKGWMAKLGEDPPEQQAPGAAE